MPMTQHIKAKKIATLFSALVFGALPVAWSEDAAAICNGGLPDGNIVGGDQCDDGNLNNGDGCSLTCDVEPGWTCAIPLQLNSLTTETLNRNCTLLPSDWQIDADKLGVSQLADPYPTVALFNADAKVTGTFIFDVTISGTTDNDFFGFVLGYNPGDFESASADFILLDWQRLPNKLKLSRINGPTSTPGCSSSSLTNWDLWSKRGAATPLATSTALPGSQAWVVGQTYRFEITYTDTQLRVVIDGVEQFNLTTTAQNPWPDGQLGLYNFSQPGVSYRIISPLGPSICNRPPSQSDATRWITQGLVGPYIYNAADDFSDPDGQGLDPQSVRVISAPANVSTRQPSEGAAPGTLEITPDDASLLTSYAIQYEVCDDLLTPEQCDQATLTVRVNDPPTIAKQSVQTPANQPTTITALTLLNATNTGMVDNGVDLTSIALSTTATGPFSQSVASAQGGTCEILAGNVLYTPPNAASGGTTDRCFVRLCEQQPGPLGTDPTGRACGVGELEIALTGAAQDLLVQSIDASALTTNRQTLTTSGQVDVTIQNQGFQSVNGPFDVALFLDNDHDGALSGGDLVLGTQTVNGPLAALSSQSLSFNVSASVDFAGQPLFAAVDSADAVTEDDETNNIESTASLSCAGQADAQTSRLRYDLSSYPASISFTARIGNAGTQTIPASTKIGFYNGDPNTGGVLLGESTLPQALQPGRFADVSFTWLSPPASLNTNAQQLYVRADNAQALAECREANTHNIAYPIGATITAPANAAVSNETQPTIAGQGQAGSTVSVTVKDAMGVTVASAQDLAINMLGQWSFQVGAALNDGLYTITATAKDEIGNLGLGQTSTFRVDTMAPSLSILSPANNALTNDDTPTLSGSSEANAMISVTVKDAQNQSVFTSTLVADAMGLWSVDASTLADGAYTLEVSTSDSSGNNASSSSAFTVDTIGPAVAISTPGPQDILNTAEVELSGATDPGLTVDVEIRDAQDNRVYTGQATADAQGMWTLKTSMLSNGAYSATATSTDAAGNSTTSAVDFSVDTDLPTLNITSPAVDICTNVATLAVSGQTDADATLIIELVDDQDIIVIQETINVEANGSFSYMAPMSSQDGVYKLRLTAIRPNAAQITREQALTIDTVAPTLTLIAPSEGMITNDNTPTISGTTEPGLSVEILVGVQSVGTITADANGAFSFTVSDANALSDGTHQIRLLTDDGCGNSAESATHTLTIDAQAPNLAIATPINGMTVMTARPTISGITEPGLTVTVSLDGQELGTTEADANGQWTITPTEDLAEGTHKVSAKTVDEGGNEASTAEVEFTVELAQPDQVSITSPANGDTISSPDFKLSGQGTPGEQVTLTIDGQPAGNAQVAADGSWSIDVTGLPAGAHELEVSLGESSDKITVTIEDTTTTPPATIILSGGSGCAQAPSSPAQSAPLLALFGAAFAALRRRKRR